jgi:hypothetical protein
MVGRPAPLASRSPTMRRPPEAPSRQAGGRRCIVDAAAKASGEIVPDRDAKTPEPTGPPDPDWRQLLDGYAEPSRVRRLKDRQQRQQAGRRDRLRRWLWRLLRRQSRWSDQCSCNPTDHRGPTVASTPAECRLAAPHNGCL